MDPFWRFTRRMVRDHRGGLALAVVFAFLSAGGLGVGLVGIAPILQIVLNPEDGRDLADLARDFNADPSRLVAVPEWVIARLPSDPLDGVAMIIGGLAILTVLGALANFTHQFLSQTITTRAVAEVRRDAFDIALHMPLPRVVERGPSEFVARIVRDAAELQRGLIALVSKSVSQVTKGLAAFVAAVYFDWRLTLIAMVVAPVLAITLRKIGKRIRRGTRGSLEAQEGLLRLATESLQGLRAVKASTAEAEAGRRFDAVNSDVVRHELRIRTARAASGPLMETLAVFVIAALALVAARSILAGAPLERFILTLAALGVAGASLRPLAGLVNEMQAASAPARRLADVLEEPVEEREVSGAAARPALPRHAESVAFESVGYTYPGADRPALVDATLRIAHGERVAIVGPNGSGKTTLASLLPRLLVPEAGRVLVDGTDVATVSLRSLRRQIGVVTQETMLFHGTVAENIAFGCADATRDAIADAARRAHADAFVRELPGGLDADLAEQGASLSGGQRQRLAIARAILRDPALLILDEATSQIDAESEAQINAALAEFCRGRTAIIVAHRLATVLSADRIVVLDNGRVVDDGTHDALLTRCPLYGRLAETQLVGAS
jgi:ABC-type multidrug transport system fused ATPase/permease subunit